MTGHSDDTPARESQRQAWSVDDVVAYLGRLGLGHLRVPLRASGVDGAFLDTLSEEDLVQELGLSRLQARKVMGRLPSA